MVFKLSASLLGHRADVRAVLAPSPTHVVSASRDATAISWLRASPATSFAPSTTYHAGERFVNALAWVPPSKDAPEGLVATGGQDAIINLFQPTSSEPSFSLLGHEDNVCALAASPDGTIISGSWDRTARVWKDFQEAYVLKGHTQAVWAVLCLEENRFLTGSADRTIKLWHGRKDAHTYTGHTDAVRGLAPIEGLGFASCSNDSEVRIWSLDGETLQVLSGHTSFVYSLAVLPSGLLLSSSEDRSVRVWRDGDCIQTIVHPAISVWSVAAMPNGDFVTGASDGVVRVFSEVDERWASAEDLKTYDASVQSQTLPSQQVGDVKKTDLPGPEALSRPGNKEGQVMMIKQGDVVEAHQWSTATRSWSKVGEVMDAVGSSRKQLYNGKEYDYVFDVDVTEGAPPLKLPYNANENPYTAAQRFLANNDLPPGYLDEVVKFIEKNTGGVSLSSGNSQYVDPFTGASRYQPASASVGTGSSSYADPFTGGSRYQPGAAAQPPPPMNPNQFMDPFTGASSYTSTTPAAPAITKPAPKPATTILPVKTPLSFTQVNFNALQTKLLQFNDEITTSVTTTSLQMSTQELQTLEDSIAVLRASTSNRSLPAENVQSLLDIASRWPEGFKFPLIHILSLVCAQSSSSVGPSSAFVVQLLDAVQWDQQEADNKSRDTNGMLAIRAVANLDGKDGGSETWERLRQVNYAVLSKNHRVALATVTLNASTELLRQSTSAGSASLLQLILKILQSEQADSETVYRAVVAAGNLLFLPDLGQSAVQSIKSSSAAAAAKFKEERLRNVVNEIKAR